MIVEISVVPIGVGESLSKYVAEVLKILEERGLKYQLTPMGTIVELEEFDELCRLLKDFDSKLFEMGSKRNYYVLKIDNRIKGSSMEYKIKSVLEKMR